MAEQTDPARLRELADMLDYFREWPSWIGSAELCRQAAGELELSYSRIETLLDSLRKSEHGPR